MNARKWLMWGAIAVLLALLIMQLMKRYGNAVVRGSTANVVQKVAMVMIVVGILLLTVGVAIILPIWLGLALIGAALVASYFYLRTNWNASSSLPTPTTTQRTDPDLQALKVAYLRELKKNTTVATGVKTNAPNYGRYF